MINVVIPMAGLGSRFSNAGYTDPKPFIMANGKRLIEIVLDNLQLKNARYILIARKEHLDLRSKDIQVIKSKYNVDFVFLDNLTEGAACTVLAAHRSINNDTPLLLANSDQYIHADVESFISDAKERKLDGSILTFVDSKRDPKWSFAKLNSLNLVTEVKEKAPISEYATVGLYYFAKGSYFVDSAIDMIVSNDRVNNEFYTCPVYNYVISKGLKIGIFSIPQASMYGLGTPEDLEYFIQSSVCP